MKTSTGEVLTGPQGTATEIIYEIEADDRPDMNGTVATWFLDCPGQSVAWRHYLLAVVHLRPLDGMPPPTILIPGATHQVFLLALDPTLEPEADNVSSWQHLTPHNIMEQIELPNDKAAKGLIRRGAQAVVDGVLPAEPPLAGAVEPWRTALIKTVAHLRGEPHAP